MMNICRMSMYVFYDMLFSQRAILRLIIKLQKQRQKLVKYFHIDKNYSEKAMYLIHKLDY